MTLDSTPRSSNKGEILRAFREFLPAEKWRLLEIGSGTGHHAVYLAAHFDNLQWVASDVAHRQVSLKKTISNAGLSNVHGPIEYEIGKDEFPVQKFNAAFASQVLQEITWKQAKSLFKVLGNRLRKGSQVIFYGPLRYQGALESERVESLERSLKELNPQHGIRAFEDVVKSMNKAGFDLKKDYELPGENHLLLFERLEHQSKS